MENDFSVLQMLGYAMVGMIVAGIILLPLFLRIRRKTETKVARRVIPVSESIVTVTITDRNRQHPRQMRVGDTVFIRELFLPANTPVVIAEIGPNGDFVVHQRVKGNVIGQYQISPDAVTYELTSPVTA